MPARPGMGGGASITGSVRGVVTEEKDVSGGSSGGGNPLELVESFV